MMLTALMLAAAIPANVVDQDSAGNRIEPFVADSGDGAPHCTSDRRWCAEIVQDGGGTVFTLSIFDGTQGGEARRWNYELMAQDDRAHFVIFPRIIRVAMPQDSGMGHSAFIGVETQVSAMYSGGGANASRLSLIRVNSTGEPPIGEILDVPLSASAMIRACFGEDDMKQRAGACHDSYGFDATLALAAPTGTTPVFTFQTKATRYPGHVSRRSDSLEAPPLKAKDLVTVTDAVCSYRRTLRFNPATDRYEFDTPAPDCSEFTVP